MVATARLPDEDASDQRLLLLDGARRGVPEVWFWRDGRPELLRSFLDRPATTAAVRAYRAALRARVPIAGP